jgi:hypothetical protein
MDQSFYWVEILFGVFASEIYMGRKNGFHFPYLEVKNNNKNIYIKGINRPGTCLE